MKSQWRPTLLLVLLAALAFSGVRAAQGQTGAGENAAPRVISSTPAQREIVGPGIQKNPMGLAEKFFGDAAVRDTGLARHHHDLEAAAIQQSNRVDRVGKQHETLETIEISNIFDHRPVPIDEHGRT